MKRSPLLRVAGRGASSLAGTVGLLLALAATGCGPDGSDAGTGSPVPESPSATWSAVASQGASAGSPSTPALPFEGNPFVEADPHLAPDTAAAAAAGDAADAEESRLLSRLAEVPTAAWLLPEALPPGSVGPHVADLVHRAEEAGEVAVLVLYGVPGRDCVHGYSGGGLPAEEYLAWVEEVARAAGPRSVVVLEPDALASVDRCQLDHDRIELLSDAVGILADGPVTYIDAGHSNWLDATTAADRLRRVGVDRVRGFSLNVSGFGDEPGERSYGEQVASDLGGAHFVVDSGRAGNGSDGTWCNPPGRAVGALPGAVPGAGPMDARLWVKPPGESDGTCGGGPEAGTFWTERALEMVRAAGW